MKRTTAILGQQWRRMQSVLKGIYDLVVTYPHHELCCFETGINQFFTGLTWMYYAKKHTEYPVSSLYHVDKINFRLSMSLSEFLLIFYCLLL